MKRNLTLLLWLTPSQASSPITCNTPHSYPSLLTTSRRSRASFSSASSDGAAAPQLDPLVFILTSPKIRVRSTNNRAYHGNTYEFYPSPGCFPFEQLQYKRIELVQYAKKRMRDDNFSFRRHESQFGRVGLSGRKKRIDISQRPSLIEPWANCSVTTIFLKVAMALLTGSVLFTSPDISSADTTTTSSASPTASFVSKAPIHSILQSSIITSNQDIDITKVSKVLANGLDLSPPTEDRPQITLDGRKFGSYGATTTTAASGVKSSISNANARMPILQGLVYFPELQPRPSSSTPSPPSQQSIQSMQPKEPKPEIDYYNDLLVLTATSSSQPNGPILAGAKIPLSTIRFPFNFQMYEDNLLLSREGVRDAWFGSGSGDEGSRGGAINQDVIIKACICPNDALSTPCGANEQKRYAEGVAKLITALPGLQEGGAIRAPASLPLH